MPEYTFAECLPHTFPESRHSDGTPVGAVEPGEIRDLPEAPNHQWRETTDEDREAWAAVLAAREAAAEEEPASPGADQDAEWSVQLKPGETVPLDLPKPPRTRKTAASTSEAGVPGGNEG